MRATLRFAACAALTASFTGCVATQRDMLELENQTDELKHQIGDLKKTVTSLQANQADLSTQMKQLNESLLASTEATREGTEHMAALSSKLDDMSERVTSKVAAIGSSLSQQQAEGLEKQKAERSSSPTELFNTADVRLGVKSYDLAAKGFEEYLAKYPKGALADVATYKLGQAHFGRKKWEEAGRQFAVVLESYPKSEMTASSRLMYALSLLNMKKDAKGLEEARQYLESVVADFPRSPEAKAAQAQLAKLAKSPR